MLGLLFSQYGITPSAYIKKWPVCTTEVGRVDTLSRLSLEKYRKEHWAMACDEWEKGIKEVCHIAIAFRALLQ